MPTQSRAQLAQLLDELQATLPRVLTSGPMDRQCELVVGRAAAILDRAPSLDRAYVSDRLAWILARLPLNEKDRGSAGVETQPLRATLASRRRVDVLSGHASGA